MYGKSRYLISYMDYTCNDNMNISISLYLGNESFSFGQNKSYFASPGNPFSPGWLCAASLFSAFGIADDAEAAWVPPF